MYQNEYCDLIISRLQYEHAVTSGHYVIILYIIQPWEADHACVVFIRKHYNSNPQRNAKITL